MSEYFLRGPAICVSALENRMGLIDILLKDTAGDHFLYCSLEKTQGQYFSGALRVVKDNRGRYCIFTLINKRLHFFDLQKKVWKELDATNCTDMACIDITQPRFKPEQLAIFILSDASQITCFYFNPATLQSERGALLKTPASATLVAGLRADDGLLAVAIAGGSKVWYCQQNDVNSAEWEDWVDSSTPETPVKLGLQQEGSTFAVEGYRGRLSIIGKGGQCYATAGIQRRWRAMGSENTFTRHFTAIANHTGFMEVFATDKRGYLLRATRQAHGGWGRWEEFYKGELGCCSTVASGREVNGGMVIFIIAENTLYRKTSVPQSGWSTWVKCCDGCEVGGFIVTQPNACGRLEVYVQRQSGEMVELHQTDKWNSDWSGGSVKAGSGEKFQAGTATLSHDKRIAFFARNAQGTVRHSWQDNPDNGWCSGYKDFGKLDTTSPIACASNADGRIEIMGLINGQLSIRWQNIASAHPWTDGWHVIMGERCLSLSGLRGSDNCLLGFVVDESKRLWVCRQKIPGGGWGWESILLGTGFAGPVTACVQGDGVDVFALSTSGKIAHMRYIRDSEKLTWSALL